jgi:2'-5' RNA ligase
LPAPADALRLFVAVDPSPAAVADLGAVVDALEVGRAKARLAGRERWHVTLAFLGDVPAARAGEAGAALRAAAAAVQEPISVRFAGGGTFGRGRFTVLWAGLAGDVDALRSLAQGVRAELRRARLPFDSKGFRPHLTIARPGDRVTREQIDADVTTLQAYQGPAWPAGQVHLVASELGPDPRHTRVESVALL